jgi:hypothetical protein
MESSYINQNHIFQVEILPRNKTLIENILFLTFFSLFLNIWDVPNLHDIFHCFLFSIL